MRHVWRLYVWYYLLSHENTRNDTTVQRGGILATATRLLSFAFSETFSILTWLPEKVMGSVVSPRLELRGDAWHASQRSWDTRVQYVSSIPAMPTNAEHASEHIFRVSSTSSSAYSIGYRSHAYSLRSLRKSGNADASTPQSGYCTCEMIRVSDCKWRLRLWCWTLYV